MLQLTCIKYGYLSKIIVSDTSLFIHTGTCSVTGNASANMNHTIDCTVLRFTVRFKDWLHASVPAWCFSVSNFWRIYRHRYNIHIVQWWAIFVWNRAWLFIRWVIPRHPISNFCHGRRASPCRQGWPFVVCARPSLFALWVSIGRPSSGVLRWSCLRGLL